MEGGRDRTKAGGNQVDFFCGIKRKYKTLHICSVFGS